MIVESVEGVEERWTLLGDYRLRGENNNDIARDIEASLTDYENYQLYYDPEHSCLFIYSHDMKLLETIEDMLQERAESYEDSPRTDGN